FYSVTIRSGVRSEHTMVDRMASGERQDGCICAACAKRLQHLNPVATRQHPIEYDHVETFAAKQKNAFIAGLGHRWLEALAPQPARKRARSLGVIFDQ